MRGRSSRVLESNSEMLGHCVLLGETFHFQEEQLEGEIPRVPGKNKWQPCLPKGLRKSQICKKYKKLHISWIGR